MDTLPTPATLPIRQVSSKFCYGGTACNGRLVALIATDTPNLLVANEYGPDGFTASDRRHVCTSY